jgi:cytochrome d ubiquinol oxidase subunit II
MGLTQVDLANVWLFLIAFFLLYYVVADGYDLGVGILSLLQRDDRAVGAMMGSLGSVWTANQTWLVLLGGMLFGAFPLFYSILLSSLYLPLVVMLFGFVARGVSFEFREQSRNKKFWSLAFGLGSLVATLAQGFALGGLLGGLNVEDGRFAGGVWDWLSPYSTLVAAGVLFGYVMLGANYLILRTAGSMRHQAYRYSLAASLLTFGVAVGVHFWTSARYARVAQKWSTLPDGMYLSALLLLALFSFWMLTDSLRRRRRVAPLAWNVALIFFSFLGLSVGLYPHMIPSVVSPLTVRSTAASPDTLFVMLVVTAVILPLILVYTGYVYRVTQRGVETGKGSFGYGEE